jgi:hypothetical protein
MEERARAGTSGRATTAETTTSRNRTVVAERAFEKVFRLPEFIWYWNGKTGDVRVVRYNLLASARRNVYSPKLCLIASLWSSETSMVALIAERANKSLVALNIRLLRSHANIVCNIDKTSASASFNCKL